MCIRMSVCCLPASPSASLYNAFSISVKSSRTRSSTSSGILYSSLALSCNRITIFKRSCYYTIAIIISNILAFLTLVFLQYKLFTKISAKANLKKRSTLIGFPYDNLFVYLINIPCIIINYWKLQVP